MKSVFLSLFALLMVASCKKECHHATNLCAEPEIGMGDCITDSTYVKPLILGKWNWTQTVNSWATTKSNPCTDSLNYTYEFLSNKDVKVYLNGSHSSTSHYGFVQTWTSEIAISNDSTFSEHPGIYTAQGAVRLCGNYLIIDNSPVDGPKSIFLKE